MLKNFMFSVLLASCFFIAGCGNNSDNSNVSENTTTENQQSSENNNDNENSNEDDNNSSNSLMTMDNMTVVNKDDNGNIILPQLEDVKSGDTIVTISTTMGEIKIRLFPEYAPKAVENFVTHAKDGYYDGVIFHRVIKDFMIQSGDPEGTGRGGESIWGKDFGLEMTPNLHNFRGALAMANTGMPDSNGSQFYIVQNNKLDDMVKDNMQDVLKNINQKVNPDNPDDPAIMADIMPERVINEYIENGGYPYGDYNYTVFGQVFEGMDVVDKIASVETEKQDENKRDRPFDDIIINSMTVSTY